MRTVRLVKSCKDWKRYRQHKLICKNRKSKSDCVRGRECMFLNKKYIWIVDKYFKQKCDACHFDSDKGKLKIYNIMEQWFTPCHKGLEFVWNNESGRGRILWAWTTTKASVPCGSRTRLLYQRNMLPHRLIFNPARL